MKDIKGKLSFSQSIGMMGKHIRKANSLVPVTQLIPI